jgi:hypothetical protein
MEGTTMMILIDLLIARGAKTSFEGKGDNPVLLLAFNVPERITHCVRVCPVRYHLKTQVLFLRYYIKKHALVQLYRLLVCMYSTKSTHIIIIISTKVQYSIVSVPTVWICVI